MLRISSIISSCFQIGSMASLNAANTISSSSVIIIFVLKKIITKLNWNFCYYLLTSMRSNSKFLCLLSLVLWKMGNRSDYFTSFATLIKYFTLLHVYQRIPDRSLFICAFCSLFLPLLWLPHNCLIAHNSIIYVFEFF